MVREDTNKLKGGSTVKATISLKGGEYVLDIGETQVILGGQGGLSDENIKEMLKWLYRNRVNQVVLGPQGGLSPENIEEMLKLLYKIGEPPIEVIFTLKGDSDSQ